MIDRKEVELLIRAQLKGGRDIESITRSIKELEEAITQQAAAARKGESSYDGLKASQTALATVQQELAGRVEAVNKLLKNADGFTTLTERVNKTRKALEAYQAKVGEDRTEAQQEKLTTLTKKFQSAEAALSRLSATNANYVAALTQAGIQTTDLSAAQRLLAEQQARVEETQNRVNGELREYNSTLTKARDAARALADQQQKLERLQQGNETDARVAAQQQLDRLKRIEQAESDRLATLEAYGRAQQKKQTALVADSELAAIRDSERFLRQYTQAKEEAAKRDAGLTKAAEDAERTARSYQTLGRASRDLRPRVVSLREAIDGIVNPGARARETLAGVEQQIQEVAGVIAASQGGVKDYAEQFRTLQAAQKAISGQAGLIDGFQRQLVALRATRAELVSARTQVAQYAAEVRKGGDAGEQFLKPLAEAQNRLRAAAAAMRDQVAATRQAREALQQAGIGTRDLAGANERLINATKASTAAMSALSKETNKVGAAAKEAGGGFKFFRDEGRTTLSLAQRIRGEVLALAAGYVGVQGAISLARDALNAFNQDQGLRSGLSFAFGDNPAVVGDQINYVREQADRLGVAFESSSKSYVKFAAAAIKSGAPLQEVQFIFESFAETARTLNLTPDELNGLFTALGQSFSKGKIQAEELRQQIGERLPGAFQFAQEALAKEFPDLNKALEGGKVGAENLLLIAESVRRAAAGGLKTAISNLDSEQQRFNNSVFFFKKAIADAGFADAYIALLKQLTDLLKSGEGERFAQSISRLAEFVVKVISTLVDLRDELAAVAVILGGGLLAKGIVAIGAAFLAMGTAAAGATGPIALMSVALSTVGVALRALGALVAAFFVGAAIGNWMYEQSEIVRAAGVNLIANIDKIWTLIKYGAMRLWADLPRLVNNGLVNMVNAASGALKGLLGVFRRTAAALGLSDFANSIDKTINAFVSLQTDDQASPELKKLEAELARELKIIEMARESALLGALRRDPIKQLNNDPTKAPGKRSSTIKSSDDDKAAKKLATEIERIEAALTALETKIQKKQEDTLESLINASTIEYRKLAVDIAQIGGEAGQKFAERFKNGLLGLQEEIRKDFFDKLAKEQETLQSKLDQLEAQAGRKNKADLDSRLEAVRKAQEQFYRDIEQLRQKRVANNLDTGDIDRIKAQADAAVGELVVLERQKVLKEQLEQKERSINDLLNARQIAIKQIEEAVIAGNLTRSDADLQIRGLIADMQPGIAGAIESARQFAIANRDAFDPAALQEFLLKMEQAKNSSGALSMEFDRIGQMIDGALGQGITDTFNSLYDSILQVADGTKDWGDAFEAAGKVILQTIAQLLKDIALMIIKEQILFQIQVARQAISGGTGGLADFAAGLFHSGGVVGQGTNRTRAASPAWFAGAPKYHAGGVVGLAPDEYPAILKKNEEVLATSDPRNVMNGARAGAAAAQPKSMRVVLVDDPARAREAMMGAEGEEVTLMHLRKNLPTVRQLLGT